jgi:hypothetical protein
MSLVRYRSDVNLPLLLQRLTKVTLSEIELLGSRMAELTAYKELLALAAGRDPEAIFSIYRKLRNAQRSGQNSSSASGIDRTVFLHAAADLGHIEALEILASSALQDPHFESLDELVLRSQELAEECWRKLAELGVAKYRHKVLKQDLYSRAVERKDQALAALTKNAQGGCKESAQSLSQWYSSLGDHYLCYVWSSVAQKLGCGINYDMHRLALNMSVRTTPRGHWQGGWIDKDLVNRARDHADRIIDKA